MRSESALLGEIWLDFAGIPHLGEMKIFHMNTRKWGGIEFSLISFVFFQLLFKSYKTIFSPWMNQIFAAFCFPRLYLTVYCKKCSKT